MGQSRILNLFFFVLAFCFWLFWHPEWLNFHEQYQMFLFSFDYLKEHLALPGGFVVWLSEFFVQFFYNTFSGAAVVALVLTGIYLLNKTVDNQLFALLPSVLIWIYAGDENMLFTFPTAVLSALALSVCYKKINFEHKFYLQFLLFPLIYWLIGYCVWIYVLLTSLDALKNCFDKSKKMVLLSFKCLILCFFMFLVAYTVAKNYPLIDIFCGIDYYRDRMIIPFWQHLIALSCVVVPYLKFKQNKVFYYAQIAVLVGGLFWGVIKKYDKLRYDYIKIDYFARWQKWDSLLKFAKNNNLNNDFTTSGINLALAMTNQLPDRLFEFRQTGNEGFLSTFGYNMFSCGPTAEACYYLGLNNSVLRYNFDMQSAILNCKNSGRFFKRIAESYILNRRYDVAQRYLNKLKKTLFYRSWALDAEKCLYNENKVKENPEWARILKCRVPNGLNFSHSDMSLMLVYLFEQCPENRMAIDYALSAMLVNKDLRQFVKYFPLYTKSFGTSNIPEIYQQAFLLACFQNGFSFDQMPDFISEKVKNTYKDFDRTYLLNAKSKAFTTGKFANTFWTHYLIER